MGRGYVADAPWQEDRGGWSGIYAGPRSLHDGRDRCSSLVQVLVTREGQELYELVVGRDTGEEFGGFTELVLFPAFGTDDVGLDLLQFLIEGFVEEVFRHFGAVFEDTSLVVDPLPHLGAADLRGRRVLHQVEDGNGPTSREPGRDVLHTDGDVVAEAVHGDVAFRFLQKVLCGGTHVGYLVELAGLQHVLVEGLLGERDHPGVGDPGPVVAVLRLALLILAHLVVGELSPLGVIAAWDLGRHPPHRVRAALVAGLDGKQRVGAHERDRHGHRVAVREEHVLFAELLDVGEDVVPPAAVETGGVLAKLVEDLVHLECGEYRLDQDRSLDGAPWYAELVLGRLEDVVPEPGLEVTLQLRQVEVRSGAVIQQPLRVVEEVKAEVEETTWNLFTVNEHVLLEEVPPARPRQDDRNVFVQLVVLACLRIVESDGAFDGLFHVELALQHVVPGGAVGVLEVCHPAARPRVQRVDRHLSVGGAREFHAPVLKVVWDRRDLPVALPDLPRLRQEIRHLAGADSLLPLGPHGKELFHSPPVLPRELGHESDSFGREYPGELVRHLGSKLDPLGVGARLIRHYLQLLSTASRARLLYQATPQCAQNRRPAQAAGLASLRTSLTTLCT